MRQITFEEIEPTVEQVEILYKLLAERSHSISHAELPTFEAHSQFVQEHPYRAWFLVRVHNEHIGSLYLNTDNTVGINLKAGWLENSLEACVAFVRDNFKPLEAIKSVRAASFAINVAPSNQELVRALETHGHRLLQVTYGL